MSTTTNGFPDLKAEKILRAAYAMKQRGYTLALISYSLSAEYETKDLADALAVIATQFNWKRL